MNVDELLALDARCCDVCGVPFALFNGDAPLVFKSRRGVELAISHEGECAAKVVQVLDASRELWDT